MSTTSSPGTQAQRSTTVVRVSCGTFDPDRFEAVQDMAMATSSYLIPAISKLPGLISYYAGVSPDGSMINVSIWDSAERADQMTSLREMTVNARSEAEQVGVSNVGIVTYPVDWAISAGAVPA